VQALLLLQAEDGLAAHTLALLDEVIVNAWPWCPCVVAAARPPRTTNRTTSISQLHKPAMLAALPEMAAAAAVPA
jgi:hypothetical protein